MTRYRAIFDSRGLKAEIENDQVVFWREDPQYDTASDLPRPMVVRDIEPYQNMIDGKMISSRAEHREFIRRNNVIEIGNEDPTKHIKPPPKTDTRREVLTKRLADMSDKQADKLLKQLKKGA